MNKRLRAVITLSFVTLFLVTVPVVLLWTAGYSFNWKRQRVQKTGIIQVESVPKNARVLIDGASQKKTTPAMITRLLPEDYSVTVEADGYLPWHKTLEVKSSQTTFATGIVLYKNVLSRIDVEKRITASAWSTDGTQVAFVAENGDSKEVSAVTPGKNPLLLARFPKDSLAEETVSWSPDGKFVLLVADSSGATHVIRFSADDSFPPLSVSDRFPKGKLTAHWTVDGGIGVIDAAGAYVVNATTGKSTPALQGKNALDVDSRGSVSYVLHLTDASRKGEEQRVILEKITADGPTPFLNLPVSHYRFVLGDEGHILIQDQKKGQLLAVDRNDASFDTLDATGTQWEPKGSRLLLWNGYEISLYDPRDGSRELVTRIGSGIEQCAFSPSGDGILYSTPNGISFVELDPRDVRNTYDLVRYSEGGPFAIDRSAKLLRFTGSIGSQHGIFERDL